MKQRIRTITVIGGALCIWVMMFGFDPQGGFVNPIVGSSYAAESCESAANKFAGCDTYCKTNNDQSCVEYKQGKLGSLATTLDSVLSFLYLVMWPILYIAGLAMDNTLVYGEGLGLTGLLYQFWGIMRTFSNFAIVFLLVYTIGMEMFNGTAGAKALGKTILAIMLGGVAINASRFLIGAMVDVSTIATYGVGTIPLSLNSPDAYCNKDNGTKKTDIKIMEDIKKLGTCRPLLSTHSTLNLSDTLDAEAAQYKSYYSYTPKDTPTDYYLTCPIRDNKIDKLNWDKLVSSFAGGGVYTKADGTTGSVMQLDQKVKDYFTVSTNIGNKYCVIGSNQLLDIQGLTDKGITVGSSGYYAAIVGGMQNLHNANGLRIKNLVDGNKGMIGVMYTMYGNILGFSQIKTDVSTNTPESQIIQFIVKGFFGFAMLFPLIALCIVLVMRVAILWLVIGFAPILVLLRVLQVMGIKNESLSGLVKSFGEKANFGQIMSLLFQPVLVVFVISIGLMFMDALMNTLTIDNGFGEALQCREIVKGEQCCKVVDFMDICFKDFDSKVGTDAFFNYFTFAITNIIGVMLLWFMVFAVLKSNEITKKVAEKIQNIGENYLGSMPVIPWFDDKGRFGWDAVGVKGASSGIGSAWQSAIKGSEDTTGKTVVEPSLTRFYDNLSGKTNTAKDGVSKAVEDVATADLHTNTASREIFGNKLVEAIGNAKKNKYANANELLDASNGNIKKLLYHYDSDNALELLSNPRFIAETKSSSTKMADAFAINAGYGPGSANSKAEYYAKLKEQTDNLYKGIGSGKKIAGSANNVDLIEADEGVYKITKSGKQNEIYDVGFANISKESSLSDVTSGAEKLGLTYEQAKNLKLAEGSWKEGELKKTWELDRGEGGSIASFKDTTPPKEVNPPVASEADTP